MQKEEGKVKTVTDFIFLGFKITGRNINNLKHVDDTARK